MSYIVIVLDAVFAANALLVHGFGLCPSRLRHESGSMVSAIAIMATNALASSLLWCLRVAALRPLGLESLDILLFALAAVPVLKALFRSGNSGRDGFVRKAAAAAEETVVSCLVFGIALTTSRAGYSLPEALAASVASGIGYWAAIELLGRIGKRLALSAVPERLRGTPAILISAGLMAMAFMCIDTILVRNLAG